MENSLFNDLVESLKEAKSISKGETKPSRVFNVSAIPDVKIIREKLSMSQTEFAKMMHVSHRTVQNWEQKRRVPTGAAVALLNIVSVLPADILINALEKSGNLLHI